jgi:hypothetical protein
MATLACLWSKCSWTEVWAKNMTNGRIAVVLFNRAGVLYDFGTDRAPTQSSADHFVVSADPPPTHSPP